MNKEENIAFVDGQNLYMSTQGELQPWVIDLKKFRIYLEKKYHVTEAYYFLGYIQDEFQDLYTLIQKSGFILKFRKHDGEMLGKKKGNVDTEIIFSIMKKVYKKEKFDNVVLVSGDGDYKILVDFLIEEKRFKKILFPNQKRASTLYKKIDNWYYANLNDINVKNKIRYIRKKGLR